MKKIIFIITFLFFFLGINNVFSNYIEMGSDIYIGSKKCNFTVTYGNFNGTLIKCNDGFEKKYNDIYLSNLQIDFGNGDFYHINARESKYYYLRKDFSIDTYSFLKDSNCNDSNMHFMYNGVYRCDGKTKPGYSPFQFINVHGNKTYWKSNYDVEKKSHNYNIYTVKNNSENEFTVNNVVSINSIAQVGPDSYSVAKYGDSGKIEILTYNPSNGDNQITVTSLDNSLTSSSRLTYNNNGKISIKDGNLNYSSEIHEKFTKGSTSNPNTYDGLEGKFGDKTLNTQINGTGEFLSCREFESSVVPTCSRGEFLKLNGINLTCEKGNPSSGPVNFTLDGKQTFNYYVSSVNMPSCAYLEKKVTDPIFDPGDTVDPDIPQENPDNENNGIGGFLSGLGSKLASGLKSITDGISGAIGSMSETLSGLGSKLASGLKSITDGIGGAIGSMGETLSGIGSKLASGLKSITDGIGKAISDGFGFLKGIFTGDYGEPKITDNGVNFDNLSNVNTKGEGFIQIDQGKMPNLVKDGEKCKLFNENNLTFLYYSNGTANINFSLRQYAILDNSFGGFLDFVTGLFIGPINNIIAITKTFTPFTSDNQQVCLFGEVKTIEFHKFMKGTENYGVMTIFDYLVLFTFSGFVFFLIGGITFFKGIETPGGFNNPNNNKYQKKGYISKENIKKHGLTREEIKRIT